MVIQVSGFIAMFFSIFSFQMKTHKRIMILQMGANALFAIQYLLMAEYSGATMHAIAFTRGIVFYFNDRQWASHKGWIILYVLMFAGFGTVTYNSLLSVLPPLAMVLNTFSFASKKPQFTRITILISSPMWLLYSVVTGSVGGAINECFVMCSSILGYIRYKEKTKFTMEAEYD